MPDSPPTPVAPRVQRLLQSAEDVIHLIVAVLLVLVGALLLADVVKDVVDAVSGPYHELAIVLAILDNSLVLFIVAELLHTVRLTIRNHTLNAEPFLVVGLIAGVRKILIVTAQTERSFQWQPQGVEILMLVALVLAMAVAILVLRHATRPDAFTTDLGRP